MSKKRKNMYDEERIREYRWLQVAEHDPDFITDPDEAYRDYLESGPKTIKELMEEFPPEQPIDIREWTKEDFRDYFEALETGMGKDAAWSFLYAKILERAGEGDGGIALEELFGEGWDSVEASEID